MRRASFPVVMILLIGLLAAIFCQPHPALGHEHEVPTGAEEACQVAALPSTVAPAQAIASQDKTPDRTDPLLHSFAVLDLRQAFLSRASARISPHIRATGTAKRYQLACAYLL